MNKGTTILLADDHRIVREAFKALLGAEPGFTIVGETGDGLEALRLVEQIKPDVLLLDLVMHGLNGLEVIRQLKKRGLGTRVVVLSMHADENYVLEALHNGASAYVLKDSTSADLVRAVREVAAGHRYLSPPLSEPAIEAYLKAARPAERLDFYQMLTTREREVFQLSAEGHTNPEIAKRLFISRRTAETHRAHIMHKLGLRSQTELVRFAIRRGLLPTEGAMRRENADRTFPGR